jgi:hypothetical protein
VTPGDPPVRLPLAEIAVAFVGISAILGLRIAIHVIGVPWHVARPGVLSAWRIRIPQEDIEAP